MKNTIPVCIVLAFMQCAISMPLFAQSYKEGTLLISISEGSAHTHYTTGSVAANGANDVINKGNVDGDRDPLTLEYGISSHWGLGINLGTDILRLDPAKYYGFSVPSGKVNALMSEYTIDGHYHFFVTKHTDISAVASVGLSSVTFKGNEGDRSFSYSVPGGLIRVGAQARYYFLKRLGAMAMLTTYKSGYGQGSVNSDASGQQYRTRITGRALEFGLCYRLIK